MCLGSSEERELSAYKLSSSHVIESISYFVVPDHGLIDYYYFEECEVRSSYIFLQPHLALHSTLSDDFFFVNETLPNAINLLRQILDSSKLKGFADDNFKFDENGRKLSKRVENTRYEQLLFFPQSIQKACFPGVSKGVVVWEWVN